MPIDTQQLINDIVGAVGGILKKDVIAIHNFAKEQVEALAQRAASVASGIESGGITDNTRDFFLNELGRMAEAFVEIFLAITDVLFEKVWNAVVDVIWKAIEGAISAALPLPKLG